MPRLTERANPRVERIPIERLPTLELTRALVRRTAMYGLVEVDVTVPRGRIRTHLERTGERLSFTGFLIACVARAVDEQRGVQAFRRGRRLVVFDDVDVATMVEVEADGLRVPLPFIVRDAAHKPVRVIHEEIRQAQTGSALVDASRRRIRPLACIPRPVRLLAWWLLARSPRVRQRFGGTVLITSVGSFASGGPGWGLAPVAYPVTLMVGGIAKRPVLCDGVLAEREHLCLTLALDHDVVDGAPAARFCSRLLQLIEDGAGLEDAEQEFLGQPHPAASRDAAAAGGPLPTT